MIPCFLFSFFFVVVVVVLLFAWKHVTLITLINPIQSAWPQFLFFIFLSSLSLSLLICKNPLKMFHSLFCRRERKEGYNQLYLDYPNNKRDQRWNLIKNRKGKKRKKMLPISDTIFSFLPFFLPPFFSFPHSLQKRKEKIKQNRWSKE